MNDKNQTKKEPASKFIINNKEKVNLKETNINKQVEKIYTIFKPKAESKGINFVFKNSLPTKEAIFFTDRKKIYTVLNHLVKKAIKHTKEGSIEFGYMGTKSKALRTELTFFVKATNKNIPTERDKEPKNHFVQDGNNHLPQQRKEFNFSSIKDYVALLEGKIWSESEKNKNAKFYFALPYRIDLEEELIQSTSLC